MRVCWPRCIEEAQEKSRQFAQEEGCTVEWSRIWNIAPEPFHPKLIEFCEEAIRETAGSSHRLPSGPLHDAAEVSRCGIPTAMMFVQSLKGISHNKIEDTREEHLELGDRGVRQARAEDHGLDSAYVNY